MNERINAIAAILFLLFIKQSVFLWFLRISFFKPSRSNYLQRKKGAERIDVTVSSQWIVYHLFCLQPKSASKLMYTLVVCESAFVCLIQTNVIIILFDEVMFINKRTRPPCRTSEMKTKQKPCVASNRCTSRKRAYTGNCERKIIEKRKKTATQPMINNNWQLMRRERSQYFFVCCVFIAPRFKYQIDSGTNKKREKKRRILCV